MLTGFNELISQVLGMFQWWIVIAPWEMAIRVRRGHKTTVLGPGMHFRIPALDRFFVQRVRKRYMNTPTQTVTSKDRQAITISGGTAYEITDIGKLYNTLSDPEDVIQIETLTLVAGYISAYRLEDLTINDIQTYVTKELDLEIYGLGNTSFLVTDFFCVKTYRLIQGGPKERDYDTKKLSTELEKVIGKSN